MNGAKIIVVIPFLPTASPGLHGTVSQSACCQVVSVMSGEDLGFLSGPGHGNGGLDHAIAIIGQKGLPTGRCMGLELKSG